MLRWRWNSRRLCRRRSRWALRGTVRYDITDRDVVKLFRRGDSADDVLVAVAAKQRWQTAPGVGALSMLPPSHAAADIHGLRGGLPPGCGGRAFTGFVVPGVAMTVSHIEVYRTDVDHEIYDVVQ
jgi:hypothetical protein